MPITIDNQTLYTVEEASDKIGISENTLRIYVREGKLIGKKAGNKWHILESSLKQLVLPDSGEEFNNHKE